MAAPPPRPETSGPGSYDEARLLSQPTPYGEAMGRSFFASPWSKEPDDTYSTDPDTVGANSHLLAEDLVRRLWQEDTVVTRLLPWKRGDGVRAQYNVLTMDAPGVLQTRTPHGGVSRLVSSRKSTVTAHMERRGLAITIARDVLASAEGNAALARAMDGLGACVRATVAFDALSAIVASAPPAVARYEGGGGGLQGAGVLQAMRAAVSDYACVQSDPYSLQLLARRGIETLARAGHAANVMALPPGASGYVALQRPEMYGGFSQGLSEAVYSRLADAGLPGAPQPRASVCDCDVYEPPYIAVAAGAERESPLVRPSQVGEFHAFRADRDAQYIELYDEPRDRMQRLHLEDHVEHSQGAPAAAAGANAPPSAWQAMHDARVDVALWAAEDPTWDRLCRERPPARPELQLSWPDPLVYANYSYDYDSGAFTRGYEVARAILVDGKLRTDRPFDIGAADVTSLRMLAARAFQAGENVAAQPTHGVHVPATLLPGTTEEATFNRMVGNAEQPPLVAILQQRCDLFFRPGGILGQVYNVSEPGSVQEEDEAHLNDVASWYEAFRCVAALPVSDGVLLRAYMVCKPRAEAILRGAALPRFHQTRVKARMLLYAAVDLDSLADLYAEVFYAEVGGQSAAVAQPHPQTPSNRLPPTPSNRLPPPLRLSPSTPGAHAQHAEQASLFNEVRSSHARLAEHRAAVGSLASSQDSAAALYETARASAAALRRGGLAKQRLHAAVKALNSARREAAAVEAELVVHGHVLGALRVDAARAPSAAATAAVAAEAERGQLVCSRASALRDDNEAAEAAWAARAPSEFDTSGPAGVCERLLDDALSDHRGRLAEAEQCEALAFERLATARATAAAQATLTRRFESAVTSAVDACHLCATGRVADQAAYDQAMAHGELPALRARFAKATAAATPLQLPLVAPLAPTQDYATRRDFTTEMADPAAPKIALWTLGCPADVAPLWADWIRQDVADTQDMHDGMQQLAVPLLAILDAFVGESPLGLVAIRPRITHKMGTAVVAAGGGAVGSSLLGPEANVMTSFDENNFNANFTFYSKPVVTDPAACELYRDVFAAGYVAGCAMEPLRFDAKTKGLTGDVVVAVTYVDTKWQLPRGCESADSFVDLTGLHGPAVTADMHGYDVATGVHLPCGPVLYRLLRGWRTLAARPEYLYMQVTADGAGPVRPDKFERSALVAWSHPGADLQTAATNTVVYRGPDCTFGADLAAGARSVARRPGRGHWKSFATPGAARPRAGGYGRLDDRLSYETVGDGDKRFFSADGATLVKRATRPRLWPGRLPTEDAM
jgi:hypothetical protein